MGSGAKATRDHFYPTAGRMNLVWKTEKVTGDHFNPTRDHLNLIFRTVKVIDGRI
jgi:hypothetical protein